MSVIGKPLIAKQYPMNSSLTHSLPDIGHTKKAAQIFLDSINKLLEEHPVERIYFPSHTLPPPPLAFPAKFPCLSFVLEGCHEMEVEKHGTPTTIRPKPGEVVILAPNHWNKPTGKELNKTLSISFRNKRTELTLLSSEQEGSQVETYKHSFGMQAEGPIPWVLKSIMELADDKASEETVCQLTKSLMLLLRDQLQSEEKLAHTRYDELCLYLKQNYHKNITRDIVAEEFNLSPSHLSRIFSENGKMRFNEYLTSIRIERAKYLLKNHNSKLDEIASSCGYVDVAYFCRLFKRLTKTTPSEYRLRARS